MLFIDMVFFFHCYADNIQLYVAVKPINLSMLFIVVVFFFTVFTYLSASPKLFIQILPCTEYLSEYINPVAGNFGIGKLSFEQHFTKLAQTCFYQLPKHCQNSTCVKF